MKTIEVADLEQWGASADCEERLPELVRRLLEDTSTSMIVEPVFGQVHQGLYTEYVQGSRWAPEEPVFWEMSCAPNVTQAADNALARFKQYYPRPDAKKSGLIFVTSRRWAEKQSWVMHVSQEESKRVRVYDAQDLVEWLTEAPKTTRWLLGKML